MDLYSVLQVKPNATPDEIKKAYRRLSMKHHPDQNKGDPESTAMFQQVSNAYQVLSDPEQRNAYDASYFGSSSSNIFTESDVNYFFSTLFSHQHLQAQLSKPMPVIKTIHISMETAFTGSIVPVEIDKWSVFDNVKMNERETIYVTLPAGIDDGEVIIMRNQGNALSSECKGDVKIIVKIEPHPHFRRRGIDLHYTCQLTLKESLCGSSFQLHHLNGTTYNIKHSAGHIISPNYCKTIPNLGFIRDGHRGNLLVTFDVKFPEFLESSVVEQLATLLP